MTVALAHTERQIAGYVHLQHLLEDKAVRLMKDEPGCYSSEFGLYATMGDDIEHVIVGYQHCYLRRWLVGQVTFKELIDDLCELQRKWLSYEESIRDIHSDVLMYTDAIFESTLREDSQTHVV